jgi:hypothetical protein
LFTTSVAVPPVGAIENVYRPDVGGVIVPVHTADHGPEGAAAGADPKSMVGETAVAVAVPSPLLLAKYVPANPDPDPDDGVRTSEGMTGSGASPAVP